MLQSYKLTEQDFRGDRFKNHPVDLKGCNDLLSITCPEVVKKIHSDYLAAGSDIIETNSFNSNAISLADYQLEDKAYEIAKTSATIARQAADVFMAKNPDKPQKFVAGSVGPTNRTASMSSDILDPGARDITFDDLKNAYADQIKGLVDGGVDLILIETVFDTLNAKAAIYALSELEKPLNREIPAMISFTISDKAARTLSGQTIEAFLASISHKDFISVGLNCGFGSGHVNPFVKKLDEISPYPVSLHPNAGFPDVCGHYDESPEVFVSNLKEILESNLVNIIGGCCGTTPEHIRKLAEAAKDFTPRKLPERSHKLILSNLDSLKIEKENNFINVGERTNVAGSAKFSRLIRENKFEEALEVARNQVNAGAQIIDVCMDDALIDGPQAMKRFLNLIASEPEISRVPVMIDSSRWDVIEAGLKVSQGKAIVNSISLKEGEKDFLTKAADIRRYGAAIVVMLFDEKGQADTLERKIEVAKRSYDLLMSIGFPPEDIIFDPNIMAIGTGMKEHDGYAKAFIDATRWIKQNLPYSKVSGGVSNLSFAFRGNNVVRGAMHSAFLFHAIEAGMDMAIVNPQLLQIYSSIEKELLEKVENLILNKSEDAAEKLIKYAENLIEKKENKSEIESIENLTIDQRLENSFLQGNTSNLKDDIEELLKSNKPIDIIDNILMPIMGRVGTFFSEGKMFLPQVVKSARVMKEAISILQPYMEKDSTTAKAGKVIIATVKGDVHDIGKNIVAVVMGCNGYEVEDLGVMVDSETIADLAVQHRVDAVLLSGLITPSLEEMGKVCGELEKRNLKIPVIIGGATTSEMHTAVRLAPLYSGPVIHAADASKDSVILAQLLSGNRESFIEKLREKQEHKRKEYDISRERLRLSPLDEARKIDHKIENSRNLKWDNSVENKEIILDNFLIEQVEEFIDWNYFFNSWDLKGKMPDIFNDTTYGEEARKLYDDALELLDRIKKNNILDLRGIIRFFPAVVKEDDLIITNKGSNMTIPLLRNQKKEEGFISMADFFSETKDYVCIFALSSGFGLSDFVSKLKEKGDEYKAIMAKLIADRLAEAFAVKINDLVEKYIVGNEEISPKPESLSCRIAVGYPAAPDHSIKKEIFSLLDVENKTGIKLTPNYMMTPEESICGFIIPGGKYFSIGIIGEDQIVNYAGRRGMTPEELKKWIPNNV